MLRTRSRAVKPPTDVDWGSDLDTLGGGAVIRSTPGPPHLTGEGLTPRGLVPSEDCRMREGVDRDRGVRRGGDTESADAVPSGLCIVTDSDALMVVWHGGQHLVRAATPKTLDRRQNIVIDGSLSRATKGHQLRPRAVQGPATSARLERLPGPRTRRAGATGGPRRRMVDVLACHLTIPVRHPAFGRQVPSHRGAGGPLRAIGRWFLLSPVVTGCH